MKAIKWRMLANFPFLETKLVLAFAIRLARNSGIDIFLQIKATEPDKTICT
jgi:hypothetical protein